MKYFLYINGRLRFPVGPHDFIVAVDEDAASRGDEYRGWLLIPREQVHPDNPMIEVVIQCFTPEGLLKVVLRGVEKPQECDSYMDDTVRWKLEQGGRKAADYLWMRLDSVDLPSAEEG